MDRGGTIEVVQKTTTLRVDGRSWSDDEWCAIFTDPGTGRRGIVIFPIDDYCRLTFVYMPTGVLMQIPAGLSVEWRD